ncbi:TPA: type II secretion system F family protein [Candidatus Ventrenecus stercoripullorum]|nr:type II secretion system F family protein [Candidatus Ventrenecus stercoripullorum]
MNERSLVRRIYTEKTIKKVEKKIKLLGINCKYNVIDLLNLRLLIGIAIFVLLLIFNKNGYILAPITVILFHYLSEYIVLDYPIKKRRKKLEEEAIFFFEVLSLTMESGRNLTKGLLLTSKNIDSELSQEFKKSLEEMSLGKSFSECLNSMKERIPSDTINNAILNIVQSSIFGNNIEESLNNQLDFLRDKHLMEVKSEIGKLPTKISIISVLFFIPIILMVILSPVLVDLVIG